MKKVRFLRLLVLFASVLLVTACSREPSVKGTYVISKGPLTGVMVTLGKETYSFSTGASGNYEVSDGKVIFAAGAGSRFSEVMNIEGGNLVNDTWEFTKKK